MKINIQNMKAGKDREQDKLFQWAKEHVEFVPELALLFHVPDIILPVAACGKTGLVIMMKDKKKNLTKEQKEYMDLLQKYNWKTAVCYSYEQAREIIRHYLARAEDFDLVNCEEAEKENHHCLGVDVSWAPCSICAFHNR